MLDSTVPRKQWWKIQWYADDDTPEERKFIIKLDLIVVPYAVLAYWVKYIDQANLSMHSTTTDISLELLADLYRQCLRRRYEGGPELLR